MQKRKKLILLGGGGARRRHPPWIRQWYSLYFSVGDMQDYNWKKECDVGIKSNGQIRWMPSGKFIVTCTLDLTYFPYDHQTCYVTWSMAQSSRKYIQLDALNQCTFNFRQYLLGENGGWEIAEIFAFESIISTAVWDNSDFRQSCFRNDDF